MRYLNSMASDGVQRYDERDAKSRLTMRISYERSGRCFWHLNCTAVRHAPPMKIERDNTEGKQTLLRCTACDMAGWYPHGSIGEVCCAAEPAPGVQELNPLLSPKLFTDAEVDDFYDKWEFNEEDPGRMEFSSLFREIEHMVRQRLAGVSASDDQTFGGQSPTESPDA